jgi:type I restriction enzyme, S subunit
MAVKKGYKKTEVGIIPEDWGTFRFADIGQVIDGDRGTNYPSKDDLRKDGFCLFLNAGNVTRFGFRFEYCEFISRIKDLVLSKGKLSRNDIVLTTRGTLGNFAYYADEVPFENIRINSGMVILRNRLPTNSNGFLYEILRSDIVGRQIERISFGSAQPQLTVRGISDLLIPIPPTLAEQEAIAGALSDADAWIESLEQLIAKKRQIKQGAMQELLTGKRRLPGFSGEWETIRLGEHCRFLNNGTYARADLAQDGEVKYLHYGDIHASTRVYLSPKTLPSISKDKAIGLDRLANGDLVLADASEDKIGVSKSIEIVECENNELVAGLHTIAVRFNEGLFANGFVGYLQYCSEFNHHLRKLAAGTKVYATNRRHVASAEIRVPSLSEQSTIAMTISNMNVEIESLESKLTKARHIKQGMMQELLTGRIRLV